jgi:ABC-type multidrug transport system permease subunit
VESGDRLFTPLGLGEPSTAMMDAIADRKDELEDIWIDIVALFGFAVAFLSAALWSLQRGKG